MDAQGDLDYDFFESRLKHYKDTDCLKIASISAGSNVSGTIFDTDRIAEMCHLNKCIATFDYAAVAPYVSINMNGPSPTRHFQYQLKYPELAYKDAVHISPHKLVGGPGSSGILICKKRLLCTKKPDRIGGGPVFFVNEVDHHFRPEIENFEEAGTPGIIQDIRTSLAF